jgi:SH3 domain-containing YSC84-like protein 1
MAMMQRRSVVLGLLAGAGTLALLPTGPARAQAGEAQILVDRARIVVDEFQNDANFDGMAVYVQNAYGVIVFPDLLKAGFIVGAEFGNGVMLTRDIRSGAWSAPAFVMLIGGSLGLQIGGKASDMILTIMNDGAIQKILSSRFKLGTDASVAAGPLGAGVGASTTTQFGEDIYSFARGKGLYGGLSLDGAGLLPKEEWNQAYYGQPVTPAAILREGQAHNPAAAPLQEALSRF